jgi:CrcB protein
MVWLVALAGAFGALGRYGVHEVVQSRAASRFPWGTVVVNVTGSFLLGLLVGLATYQGLDPDVRTVVGTGFVGAYTTFSSFSYDTFGLFESGATGGRTRAALVHALGSVAVGLVAATAGFALTGLL